MSLIEVKIPSVGESITSGILAKWHVAEGDTVKKGQLLYELETDKITQEVFAGTAGKITLKAAAGDEVKIGQIVATIESGTGDSPVGSKSNTGFQPVTPSNTGFQPVTPGAMSALPVQTATNAAPSIENPKSKIENFRTNP